ncbi:MAG: Ig-like domain-containing protein, partial [bacterium]|nr:Ig-like domain-containing protein [bacterium]
STSSLVFQGNAVSQMMPSTVNHLSKLAWNRTSSLMVTAALVLHDTLQLGQGVVDNSTNLTLRSGLTTVRSSGILMMPPVREGPNDVVYQTHGGGQLAAGNELPGNATDLRDLSINALPNDTVAISFDEQVNGRLSLFEGALSLGSNALTLRDTIDLFTGQLLTDSTSTLQIFNSPYLVSLPASVKELGSLVLNSPAGLELADTTRISVSYQQTSGKIGFGQLIYGPAATLEYNNVAVDTTSNYEFPGMAGPRNLTVSTGGALQLHAGRTIPGTLTLYSMLNTGANTVTVDTFGAGVQGTSFVEGQLAKLIPWTADTTITYELGTWGAGPSPVSVQVYNNTVPAFVTAGIKGAGHPLANDSSSCLKKFWSFSGAGLAADASLITLNYLAGDFNTGFTEAADESTMVAGRYDNGATPGWQFPVIVTRNILGTSDGGSIVLSHPGNFADNPEFTLARDSMTIFNPMVDTTNPAVTLVSPSSGATGILLQQQVVVSFSEPMDTASFRFRCTPDPLYWNLSWISGDSQVIMSHGDFAPGILYSFRVDSAADKSGNPMLNPPYQWSFTTVMPDSMSFNLAGGAYRMFSVPLSPVDSTPAQILGDELGAYSDSTWRIFGYKPSSGYAEQPNLSSGQGYWLATAGNAQVEVKGTRLMNFFNQPIDSGWNLIGDPFDTTVTLANAIIRWTDTIGHFVNFTDSTVNSVVRQRMYNWQDASPDFENNGTWDSLTPYNAGDQMHPWTGYALYAVRPCTLMMERFMGKGQVEPAKAPQYQIDWQLAMDVVSGNAVDRGLKLGVSPQAREAYDRLDAEKPPLISSNVKAFFLHQDWNQGPCQDYQTDFRPAADYIEWPLMIEAAKADQPVVLNTQITGEPGNGGYLYLLDRKKGKTFDLKTQKTIGFSGSQELAVVYSSSPFDGRNLTPLTFGLGRMGPNPFIKGTTINYQLPQAGLVSMAVYNITGQRVRTLVSQNLPPGYYSQVWDGRNDGGRALSAGVYIVRLNASGRSAAQKIVKLQ